MQSHSSTSAIFPSIFPFPCLQIHPFFFALRRPLPKTLNPLLFPSKPPSLLHSLPSRPNSPLSGEPHSPFSSPSNAQVKEIELELLGKPSPVSIPDEESPPASAKSVHLDDALAPFLKFFKAKNTEEIYPFGEKNETLNPAAGKRVGLEYYEPKPGDFVVGVVVAGNDRKIDVDVGADLLGSMLTKEVLPFYDRELAYLCCDLENDAREFMVRGKMGVVKDEEAMSSGEAPGRPVVEIGTVLFAEVLGRTLSGRPLLSSRRMFRRVAWHRVRQIQQFNEPIEVKIFEWNTGGLLTRIEGLRAFLPKAELINRVSSFIDLKKNVGRRMFVSISRVDETTNALIISEREAWDILHLKEGTLLEGTVQKIFPFGAQVRIGDSNRSGLLHISNISGARVTSVFDVLKVDEKIKVLVVKSMFPDKISLSIADLERESGLFLSDKEKVFSEAEEMAKRYRLKAQAISPLKPEKLLDEMLPFDDESKLYANWQWLKFEQKEETDEPQNPAL
ncbi:hypothetical protein KSP39_PZI006211 [Platanthera zijinensis]|uniref:S1 motif domain-containing protein n=1 Tax=Platanthera zijinensis TaxID=2320716 RepID=A0AAP0BSK4_9ASPA